MSTIELTLPRDLKPGDKVMRYQHLPFQVKEVTATVKEVIKIKSHGSVGYKVYLDEYDSLSSYDKSVGNSHLVPFIVTARNKVERVVQ